MVTWTGVVGGRAEPGPDHFLEAAWTPAWGRRAEAPPPALLPSAGAVTAALDAVEDLLLQLLPLLLLLGEAGGGRLAALQAAAVAEDAAVLSVPQPGVQAARLGQQGAVVAALGHSALVGEEREKR